MPRIDANIRTLAQSLVQDGRITKPEADKLLDAALNDKVVSPKERAELKEALQAFADKFDGDGKGKLSSFLAMKNVTLRNLAHELEKNDNVIDAADAGKLLGAIDRDGKFSSGEKYSLKALMVGSKMTAEARSVLATKLGGEAGPAGGATIDVKLPEIDGSQYRLSPDGHFQVGGNSTPARYDAGGALAAYRAAQSLAKAPPDALKDVPLAVKTKMLGHIEKSFDAGKDAGVLPQVAKERMRSAAATTLLSIIQGSAKPEEKGLRDQAIASYLKHTATEPMNDLRSSMYLNLSTLRGTLNADQVKALDDVKKSVVPQAPPYEQWFAANGERAINIKHYAHDECWIHSTDPVTVYKNKGFTLVSSHENETPQRWVLEKKNPQAPGGEVTMRIELMKTHDGLFQNMDDPKTNAIFYTGHSNLGGNVSEEMRLGKEEKGAKLVMMGLCRGKQNIPEFANKYPNTQFITTDAPSYFVSMPTMIGGMVDGLASMKDYAGIKAGTGYISDSGGKDNYFFPHEERRYEHYDFDKDGRTDASGAARDRLHDVSLKFPAGTRVDLKPVDNGYDPKDLDGSKVLHAVQFLNTLTTYHVDHYHHTSKFGHADMDAFLGGGWFKGNADEAVRVQKETVDGKTMYRVSVNSMYAEQSQFALGTMIQYEVVKQMLSERNGGVLTKDDNVRAVLFAGEYLSYMYCSYEEAESSIRNISKRSGLGDFGFQDAYKAIETDGHGYVTDAQMNAFKTRMGIL